MQTYLWCLWPRDVQEEALAYGVKGIITIDKYFIYSKAFPTFFFFFTAFNLYSGGLQFL